MFHPYVGYKGEIDVHKTDSKYITVGSFWTKITYFEQNGYYQLHFDTIPDTVDSNKNFKTIENAEKYFYEIVKKTCEETLGAIICAKCGKLDDHFMCDICGKSFCDDHLEWISFENGICVTACEKCRTKLNPALLLNAEAQSIRENGKDISILVEKRYEYIICLEDLLKRPVLNDKYVNRGEHHAQM